MAKSKKHVEGRTREARARIRKDIGTLKSLTVQPKTRIRYDKARKKFYEFLKQEGIELPTRREGLDSILAEYVEFLWANGEGRGLASDTVASIQDFDPKLKGHLNLTWRLLKTWVLNEIPSRAPPLPELALQAMVGWSLFHKHDLFALSLLVGYYGLLRTGELFDLSSSNIFSVNPSKPVILSLGLTKSGKRAGVYESITIQVLEVTRRLFHWKTNSSPQTPLVPASHQWRK